MSPVTYLPRWKDFARMEFETDWTPVPYDELAPGPVIGNDVWIGTGAMIGRGITIGDGAVVAARSVVTKDVPPFAIVAGAPAVTKKMRFSDREIETLTRTKPWRFRYADWPPSQSWENPEAFCYLLEQKVDLGTISEWMPGTIDFAEALMEQ